MRRESDAGVAFEEAVGVWVEVQQCRELFEVGGAFVFDQRGSPGASIDRFGSAVAVGEGEGFRRDEDVSLGVACVVAGGFLLGAGVWQRVGGEASEVRFESGLCGDEAQLGEDVRGRIAHGAGQEDHAAALARQLEGALGLLGLLVLEGMALVKDEGREAGLSQEEGGVSDQRRVGDEVDLVRLELVSVGMAEDMQSAAFDPKGVSRGFPLAACPPQRRVALDASPFGRGGVGGLDVLVVPAFFVLRRAELGELDEFVLPVREQVGRDDQEDGFVVGVCV